MEALIDTGADGTIVPTKYLKDIRAPTVGQARLRYHLGVRDVFLHIIDVQIEDMILPGVVVAADREGQEFILGRDVLNRLRLLIDGPDQIAQVRG